MRAISTVLDVALFLLVLSAAVGTVALAPTAESDRVTVDDTATLLGTTTLDIQFDVQGADRRAHGTPAVLLGRAAVANTSIGSQPLTPSRNRFRNRVRAGTRARIETPRRTHVSVRWQPYRGAPIEGTVGVGSSPPPTADVTAATLTVPSPADPVRDDALRAADEGYRAVADVLAMSVTDILLPGSRLEASAGRQSPTAVVSSTRFRAFGAALGANLDQHLATGDVSTARKRARRALAERIAADMRERFPSPERAAAATQVSTVHIVIRRWEA